VIKLAVSYTVGFLLLRCKQQYLSTKMKILLEDFNTKVEREREYSQTDNWERHSTSDSNKNGVKIVRL